MNAAFPMARMPTWLWFAVDQAISSATNVGVIMALAWSVSVDELSAWIVLFAVHQLCVGLVRTVIGEERLANVARLHRFSDIGRAGAAGATVGVVVIAVGSTMSQTEALPVVVLGVSIPAVFVQDVLRYRALAGSRPWLAAAADGVWLIVAAPLLLVLVATQGAGSTAAIAAWCAGGWASAITMAMVTGLRVRSQASQGGAAAGDGVWKSEARLAADYLLARGVTDVSLIIMGLVGASAAVAGVKGAQVLAAPAVLLVATWRSLVLRTFGPTGVTQASVATVRRYRWAVVAAIVVVVVPFMVPQLAGLLLSDAADLARPVLVVWLLLLTGRVIMLGEYGALRAAGDATVILRGRLIGSMLVVPAVVIAIVTDSGIPVAVGLALSAAWQAFLYTNRVRPGLLVGS